MELISSAPNQNLEFKKESIFRYIPIFLAEMVIRARELETGNAQPRMHMWNNVGDNADRAHKESSIASRKDFISETLQRKYSFLETIGINKDEIIIEADDSEDFTSWLYTELEKLITRGVVYSTEESFWVCNCCRRIIAVSQTNVSQCTKCPPCRYWSAKIKISLY